MTKEERTLEIIRRLKEEYPDAGCTLDYEEAWKLLVSVRLAAQCTDARVNVVVQELFAKYPNVAALAAATPDNWDSYDTVFIGYPIWWGIAAWPVDGFVEANDFTGKTVIPFCTSSSSGLGESGELLAELAGTGDWQEGQRFRSSASQEDINEWVDSLGLSAE